MSFIETTPIDDAENEVREMYERQQAAWGYVPNYAKSFSHRPEVMARWGKLLAELRRPLDVRTFQLITFAAATYNSGWIELEFSTSVMTRSMMSRAPGACRHRSWSDPERETCLT